MNAYWVHVLMAEGALTNPEHLYAHANPDTKASFVPQVSRMDV